MAISIGNSNAIPFISNRYDNRIPKSLRDSMVFYYDIAKQKATNESLSANPILKDLSFKYENVDWNLFGKYRERGTITVSDDGHSMNITNVILNSNLIEDTSTNGKASVPMKVTITGIPEGATLIYRYETAFGSSNPNAVNKIFNITEDGDYILPYSNVVGRYNMGWAVMNFTGECNITITQRVAHDMQLHNFTFGGLSGVGSHTTDLTKWTVDTKGVELIDASPNKVTIKKKATFTHNQFRFEPAQNISIKLKVDVKGRIQTYNPANRTSKYITDSGYIFDINVESGLLVYFVPDDNTVKQYTLEILPYYENALVFNGIAPKYVYNFNNIKLTNIINAISYNKGHISVLPNWFKFNSSVIITGVQIAGNVGESLTMDIPAFYVRVTGLEDGYTLWIGAGYKGGESSFTWEFRAINVSNGVTKIPAYSKTIEPLDENSTPEYIDCRIGVSRTGGGTLTEDLPVDITIEFLPIYDAATTTMYADIPNIPLNKVKTMIMDFVPLSDYVDMWYYDQRVNNETRNFAIVNKVGTEDDSKLIAYSSRNTQGTYINGKLNTTRSVLSLLQERHIVAVKDADNEYSGIYVGHRQYGNGRHQQMALYSLIGFDRVLNDSEIKQISDILKNR